MYEYCKHAMYPQVQIVKIPFSSIERIDFALCNQPTETPDKFYARQTIKPDIITNGGFFNMSDGTTCFGFRDETANIKPLLHSEGVGVIGRDVGRGLANSKLGRAVGKRVSEARSNAGRRKIERFAKTEWKILAK